MLTSCQHLCVYTVRENVQRVVFERKTRSIVSGAERTIAVVQP